MKNPLAAICCATGCENNLNLREVLCCAGCGKCTEDALHSSCDTAPGMRDPKVAVCEDDGCQNNANNLKVLVCSACGKCGNDSFHDHG